MGQYMKRKSSGEWTFYAKLRNIPTNGTLFIYPPPTHSITISMWTLIIMNDYGNYFTINLSYFSLRNDVLVSKKIKRILNNSILIKQKPKKKGKIIRLYKIVNFLSLWTLTIDHQRYQKLVTKRKKFYRW